MITEETEQSEVNMDNLLDKYLILLEFVKNLAKLHHTDEKIEYCIFMELDNCDYYLAQDCRSLLKKIGEL